MQDMHAPHSVPGHCEQFRNKPYALLLLFMYWPGLKNLVADKKGKKKGEESSFQRGFEGYNL